LDGFFATNLKQRDQAEDQGIDEEIILEWILGMKSRED
jgi:hypothetical protein